MAMTEPTLLIVDDDALLRDTLTMVFRELDYGVRSASEGFQALGMIQESKPDILLSDLNMPGMSGFELLSVVRRIHPAIRVIATSGAFQGRVVPPGIAADGFYEKASGLAYLLELVGQSNSDSSDRRASLEGEPIWMTPSGRLPTEEVYVLMGCPRCLRAFLKVLQEESLLVCETGCLHCHNTITYAIVPAQEPPAVSEMALAS